MYRLFITLIGAMLLYGHILGQTSSYRATEDKATDLVHTWLKIKPDFDSATARGEAKITLRPHFYTASEVQLDAKGMDIAAVSLVKGDRMLPLKFTYDNTTLRIKLDRSYHKGEQYTVFISYTARPGRRSGHDEGESIHKGMYFINAGKKDNKIPVQVWTEGEPEGTAVWCPTIEAPNQKSTSEIYITVPQAYVTLSNGILTKSQSTGNGLRTDYWKMNQPHAPYLFFISAGEFAVVSDKYKGKDVSYYVEKAYAPLARKVFGKTPEMMSFFSRITGVEYPWPKYAQIAVRGYYSGGMENTTATLFKEQIQQDARELYAGNSFENNIAHELFHQWFGDYVTAESWSNLTLNEGFANYAEYLWNEYKYGKDKGDELNYNSMLRYVYGKGNDRKKLIRFDYEYPDELFDVVSYQKGGRVLHMLRNYIGDTAFFAGMKKYLTDHRFGIAEVHQLRMAYEDITGKDLNWFFNQWYLEAGHPELEISQVFNDTTKTLLVRVKQLQSGAVFRLPVDIDVYCNDEKVRYPVVINDKQQEFSFKCKSAPALVNVDAEKILVCAKEDKKDLQQFIYQYDHAGNYVDKREAINACADHAADPAAVKLLMKALNDPFEGIVFHTLMVLDMKEAAQKEAAEPRIRELAEYDPHANIRARALALLATYNNPAYSTLFKKMALDSAYEVAGTALEALISVDSAAAGQLALKFRGGQLKGKLADVISNVLMWASGEDDFDEVAGNFDKMPLSQDKLRMLQLFAARVARVKDTRQLKKGVDVIVRFRDAVPAPYNKDTNPLINNVILKNILDSRKMLGKEGEQTAAEQISYITAKIPVR